MVHPIQAPGVELITQEYLAARRQLPRRTDLTAAQRERLENELADEHRLRCAQEWKGVSAQMRSDQDAGAGAYRNRHLFCVGSISHDRHRSILKTMEMTNQQG